MLTAHRFLAADAVSKETSYTIYVPFHFMPGAEGVDFYEKMYTRADGVIAQRLVDDFFRMPPVPYRLHLLGIILHLYADTWSHQNFMGVLRHNMNDVDKVRVKHEEEGWFEKALADLKSRVCEYTLPKLGHAQAGTLPDEPFREWEYRDCRGRRHAISNHDRAMDAAETCYGVLSRFLTQYPQWAAQGAVSWQEFSRGVSALFSEEGTTEERCERWHEAIAGGLFGFTPTEKDRALSYDDREWFRIAVEVRKDEKDAGRPETYIRKIGFERSDWKYFHDAASFHVFHTLHEVLPEYGIICD